MDYRTVKINCKCGNLLMKYKKFGKGRVLKCFFSRITKSHIELKDEKIVCPKCKCVIGELTHGTESDYIKLNQKNIKPVQL